MPTPLLSFRTSGKRRHGISFVLSPFLPLFLLPFFLLLLFLFLLSFYLLLHLLPFYLLLLTVPFIYYSKISCVIVAGMLSFVTYDC